jgi:hypothetical protein
MEVQGMMNRYRNKLVTLMLHARQTLHVQN